MSDAKLMHIMLAGACIFLALAIVITWADIARYRTREEAATWPDVSFGSTSGETNQ
jgi:hypothetical protein